MAIQGIVLEIGGVLIVVFDPAEPPVPVIVKMRDDGDVGFFRFDEISGVIESFHLLARFRIDDDSPAFVDIDVIGKMAAGIAGVVNPVCGIVGVDRFEYLIAEAVDLFPALMCGILTKA